MLGKIVRSLHSAFVAYDFPSLDLSSVHLYGKLGGCFFPLRVSTYCYMIGKAENRTETPPYKTSKSYL